METHVLELSADFPWLRETGSIRDSKNGCFLAGVRKKKDRGTGLALFEKDARFIIAEGFHISRSNWSVINSSPLDKQQRVSPIGQLGRMDAYL